MTKAHAGNGPWERLRSDATSQQLANVEFLVERAEGLLELVRDTFPTYTMHNRIHSENVLAHMDMILAPVLSRVTSLEAALLILSAYYHDIGMVFTDAQRANIGAEPEFETYLRSHPAARLKLHGGSAISLEVMEDYCRWRHADRVSVHLATIPPERFLWKSVSLRNKLAAICRSHNYSVRDLRSTEFDLFLGEADPRACAIILRLADILDFDNSRSPEAVYSALGLSQRMTPRTTISDVEWLKHLHSEGFSFPDKRHVSYELGFIAAPDSPAVEHDLRRFLDVIELELKDCEEELRHCSPRWQGLTLPGRINRNSIISDGYTFGDFKFTLDRKSILDLFMGERLYPEPWAFFRELLQNSIDACRARLYIQEIQPHEAQLEIRISTWRDDEGYSWLRIDDDGIGMDMDVIANYLFRIGRSYYSSPEFQVETLSQQSHGREPITSIGRFGVGLLSAYMVADAIELSTRRISADGELGEPIRLRAPSLDSFFVLQLPPNDLTEMPGATRRDRSGARPMAGTSIALRLDPMRAILMGTEELRGRAIQLIASCAADVVIEEAKLEFLPPRVLDVTQILFDARERTTFKLDFGSRQERHLTEESLVDKLLRSHRFEIHAYSFGQDKCLVEGKIVVAHRDTGDTAPSWPGDVFTDTELGTGDIVTFSTIRIGSYAREAYSEVG